MNLLPIRFSFLLLLQLCCYSGVTQEHKVLPGLPRKYLLAIRQHSSQGFSFYNHEGQFQFKLGADQKPIINDDREEENFYNVDFSYGVIPVTTKSGFYLLSDDGKIVKQIEGTFKFVYPIQNGYIKTYRITTGDHHVVEYYDKKGNSGYPDGQISSSPQPHKVDPVQLKLITHADSIAKARNYVPSSILRSWTVQFVDSTLFCIAFYGTNPRTKPRLLDQELNEVIIEKPGSDLWPVRFYNSYVFLEDKKEDRVIGLYLFSLKTRKISTQLSNEPNQVVDNLFIYHDFWTPETIVRKIITGEGETIFELPQQDRYMSSIPDVIALKDSVKLLDLTNPSFYGLGLIKELPNVEVFHLFRYKGETFPEGLFANWNQLVYVRIEDCESLTTLPESMKGLPKLREVLLYNTRQLEDISAWIESWPSLEYINSWYAPPEEFIQKYPHIHFDYLFYRDE